MGEGPSASIRSVLLASYMPFDYSTWLHLAIVSFASIGQVEPIVSSGARKIAFYSGYYGAANGLNWGDSKLLLISANPIFGCTLFAR